MECQRRDRTSAYTNAACWSVDFGSTRELASAHYETSFNRQASGTEFVHLLQFVFVRLTSSIVKTFLTAAVIRVSCAIVETMGNP